MVLWMYDPSYLEMHSKVQCKQFYCSSVCNINIGVKVKPNQIWQGQDDAHSLIIIARSMVLPYLIGSYFSIDINISVNVYVINFHEHVQGFLGYGLSYYIFKLVEISKL